MPHTQNSGQSRLNCIAHLLRQIPYKNLHPIEVTLPPRQADSGYKRPRKSKQNWVPRIY
jgi:hypothetical protein